MPAGFFFMPTVEQKRRKELKKEETPHIKKPGLSELKNETLMLSSLKIIKLRNKFKSIAKFSENL